MNEERKRQARTLRAANLMLRGICQALEKIGTWLKRSGPSNAIELKDALPPIRKLIAKNEAWLRALPHVGDD